MINRFLLAALVLSGGLAQARDTFRVTITNGSNMPIAPGVLYVSPEAKGTAYVGSVPTPGFVHLCQMGNPKERTAELLADKNVSSVMNTMGPVLPGQTITVDVMLDPKKENLHFEAMYGKSKDVCSTFSASGQELMGVKSGRFPDYVLTDEVVDAGAFRPATVGDKPETICNGAASAVDCLRILASAPALAPTIRFFSGYLPSVLNFLESRYGAEDTLTLIVPTSGAVTVRIVHPQVW